MKFALRFYLYSIDLAFLEILRSLFLPFFKVGQTPGQGQNLGRIINWAKSFSNLKRSNLISQKKEAKILTYLCENINDVAQRELILKNLGK